MLLTMLMMMMAMAMKEQCRKKKQNKIYAGCLNEKLSGSNQLRFAQMEKNNKYNHNSYYCNNTTSSSQTITMEARDFQQRAI